MLHKEKKEKRRKEINFSMNNFQNRGQNGDFHLAWEKLVKKSLNIRNSGTEFADILLT
jgi:hypothetical protein